jgi:hypothetical protein
MPPRAQIYLSKKRSNTSHANAAAAVTEFNNLGSRPQSHAMQGKHSYDVFNRYEVHNEKFQWYNFKPEEIQTQTCVNETINQKPMNVM